jgi:uncharacterized repeat protein (TIGR01451 family)
MEVTMNAATTTFRIVAALVLSLWMAPAFAEVTLTNTVQKVERVTAQDGTVTTRLIPAEKVVPGDEMHYTIVFRNDAQVPVDAGTIVITNPIPENTVYVADTAFGSGTAITFSVDGAKTFGSPDELTVVRDGQTVPASNADYTTIRWTFGPSLAPAAQSYVSFNVRLK